MKFSAIVFFALSAVAVVNGHEEYERYEEVFQVYEDRPEASEFDNRNLRSFSNGEAVKESDPRELKHHQGTRTRSKEVRNVHYYKRTAPESRPRDGLVVDASFRKFEPMTPDKLQVAMKAAEYSNDVYGLKTKGKKNFFFSMNGIKIHTAHKGVDRFAVHADEHFCWVIFAGTDQVSDIRKSFNVKSHELEGSNGCKVHRGFYRNYAGMGYKGDEKLFEPRIKKFLESDECKRKQVVLTGHSMGAASALIGAAIWSKMNPIAITFGQPGVFSDGDYKKKCKVNEDNVWRFINSDNGSVFGRSTYDPVPSMFKTCHHVGGYIVLPPGKFDGTMVPDQDSLVLIPKAHPEIYYSSTTWDLRTHEMSIHAKKLQKIQKDIGFKNVDVGGWIDKTRCYNNRECGSYNAKTKHGGCIDGRCTDGSNGSNCNKDYQCKSDRCEKSSITASSCYPKLPKGKRCNENSDCISNKCSWWFKCK